jgi:hypothetical protein
MRALGSLLILAACGGAAAGCGGDQRWTLDSNWQGDDRGQRAGASDGEFSDGAANTLTPVTPATSSTDPKTWFGVRLDLSMRPGTPRTPACGCLAVETGMPGKQAFQWDGEVPAIGPDAMIVAVSARGVECTAEPDESKRRASISAVERDGDDVVVEIENVPEGRPLALGAIVPKPGPSGALVFRPRDAKVRWVPQGGQSRCRIQVPTSASSPGASLSGAP